MVVRDAPLASVLIQFAACIPPTAGTSSHSGGQQRQFLQYPSNKKPEIQLQLKRHAGMHINFHSNFEMNPSSYSQSYDTRQPINLQTLLPHHMTFHPTPTPATTLYIAPSEYRERGREGYCSIFDILTDRDRSDFREAIFTDEAGNIHRIRTPEYPSQVGWSKLGCIGRRVLQLPQRNSEVQWGAQGCWKDSPCLHQ